ncbi:MAG: hypothetical protein ACT4O3_10520 [Elusimicrobiota bacterium]
MGQLGKSVVAGLGLAAAAAALVYGRKAKNRKEIRSWMLKLKGDVLEKLEDVKEVNEESYKAVVDQAAARYRRLKDVNQEELKGLVGDIKASWKEFKSKLKTKQSSRNGHR